MGIGGGGNSKTETIMERRSLLLLRQLAVVVGSIEGFISSLLRFFCSCCRRNQNKDAEEGPGAHSGDLH